MDMLPDSRAFLDLDDEHADIDAKVPFVELSLDKINIAQRRAKRARVTWVAMI